MSITSIGKFRNDNRTLLKITNGKTCAATNAVYENGRISVDINGVSDCTVLSGIKSRVRIIGAHFICTSIGNANNELGVYCAGDSGADNLAVHIDPTMAARGCFYPTAITASNIVSTASICILGKGTAASNLKGTLVIDIQPY